MELSTQTQLLAGAGALLAMTGVAVLAFLQLSDASSAARTAFERYVRHLEREIAFLRLPISAAHLALGQGIAIVALGAFAIGTARLAPALLIPLVAGVPLAGLAKKRDERVLALEEQLDTWMVGLANALRTTPALMQAIDYSGRLVGGPLAEELDLVVKERELGTPLDEAIRNMSARIGSRSVRAVLAMITIGRATGGRLPDMLEVAAAQLREMARIEGVIRTKTAEGRGQTWVLALMPFGMLAAIHWVDNHFFDPLLRGPVGAIIIGISLVLWAAAVGSAKKILDIDV